MYKKVRKRIVNQTLQLCMNNQNYFYNLMLAISLREKRKEIEKKNESTLLKKLSFISLFFISIIYPNNTLTRKCKTHRNDSKEFVNYIQH